MQKAFGDAYPGWSHLIGFVFVVDIIQITHGIKAERCHSKPTRACLSRELDYMKGNMVHLQTLVPSKQVVYVVVNDTSNILVLQMGLLAIPT